MPLSIDVWSDIACPWCWIGARRLRAAIAEFDVEVVLRWHAFELNPAAPREAPAAVDYAARLAEKYATTREEAQSMIDRMVDAGRGEGVEMRFDRIRPTNTFDAHRLLAWSESLERRTALKDRLFAAYLSEGRSISDPDELADLAADVGLDRQAAAEILSEESYAVEVRDDERQARELGVTGVPFFVLDRRLGVSGAQPAEVLLDAMRRVTADAGNS